MKVLIDVSPIRGLSPELGATGVGRWVEGVVTALGKVAPGWELHLLDPHPATTSVEPRWDRNGVHHRLPLPSLLRHARGWWTARPLASQIPHIDAVLGTTFIPWKIPGARPVPVVYDLSFLHASKTVKVGQMLFLRATMRYVLRDAPAVVTISEAVKKEIVDHYGVRPHDIFVAHPAMSDDEGLEGAGSNLGLPDEYLLFVGTIEPRKNLVTLLETISDLRSRGVVLPPLVVAGGRGWRSSQDQALLARSESHDGTRVLGYVSRDSLVSLYRRATMLVFPSLYEGFGMPPLEAMFYGCPVIASDRPAIAEVVGDAGLLVEPEDTAALGDAIVSMMTNHERREEMVARGRLRAASFTWEKCATNVVKAIEHATGGDA